MTDGATRLARFRARLAERYAARFPRSAELAARRSALLDGTSHAIRWNEPFMPAVRAARGSVVEDLDGHRIVDYWQGHMANLLGHNPQAITGGLAETLAAGRGLQSGMVHEVEHALAERLCELTGQEALRFTTSGSLGTFYATLLARAFTGRAGVLKISGGWHGSQPFGLKGIAARAGSFEHLESEGLSPGTAGEITLCELNDVAGLRAAFAARGERLACMLVEPVLGAGGGMPATGEFLREARRLSAAHGALLVADEIITGFRFRAADLTSAHGVRPDLVVLGKAIGGGMPVAAVAGRRDVLELCTRRVGRVKFEGGTYSAHELSLVAGLTLVDKLVEEAGEIYPRLAATGARLADGVARIAAEAGLPVAVLGVPRDVVQAGSLVLVHALADDGPPPASPDELSRRRHPWIGERLLKSLMLLHDVSTRNGIGAVSLAHDEADVELTLGAFRESLAELDAAGLVDPRA